MSRGSLGASLILDMATGMSGLATIEKISVLLHRLNRAMSEMSPGPTAGAIVRLCPQGPFLRNSWERKRECCHSIASGLD